MKKIIGFMALISMMIMPMGVFAASTSQMSFSCVAKATDPNIQVCTVKVTTTGDGIDQLSVKFTELNATVDKASIEGKGTWEPNTTAYPTVTFTNLEKAVGAYDLFSFEYKKATTGEICKVTLEGIGNPVDIGTVKEAEQVVDTPTENKKTGATLPYIFLGGALLIAGYAFVTTKNKSKMYKL